jgi:hypothetical protein
MLRPLRFLPIFFLAAACGGEPGEGAGTDEPAVPADSLPGTPAEATGAGSPAPADSVIAWATEIREGIRPLPTRVPGDPDGARPRAVELYVTRQERIEQAAGPGTAAPADLAESVHEAEARFHELMQLLGETPPPDSAAVESAVEALDARLAEVVELVESGGQAATP